MWFSLKSEKKKKKEGGREGRSEEVFVVKLGIFLKSVPELKRSTLVEELSFLQIRVRKVLGRKPEKGFSKVSESLWILWCSKLIFLVNLFGLMLSD